MTRTIALVLAEVAFKLVVFLHQLGLFALGKKGNTQDECISEF